MIMLDTSTIPIFGTLSALSAELQDFMYLIRTYAVWGVGNKISGPLDDQRFEEVSGAPRAWQSHQLIRCSSSLPFPRRRSPITCVLPPPPL